MSSSHHPFWLFAFCFLGLALTFTAHAQQEEVWLESPAAIAEELPELVEQLGADTESARNEAYQRLLELGGPTSPRAEKLIELLPQPVDAMPAAVRDALERVRRELAERISKLAVEASRVTLDTVKAPLEEVLQAIERQTGNRLIDSREQFGEVQAERDVTLTLEDVPFWEAMDLVLDEVGMGVYAYSGEQALTLVGRQRGSAPRAAAANYAGPLRVEVVRVVATRNLRQAFGQSLDVELEISWEPRLRPIALSQPFADVVAESEAGTRLSFARPEESADLEIQVGNQAVEMTLPLLLPTRSTESIETLRGTLQAVMPGREAQFRFDKLTALPAPETQQHGGATVTLQKVRKNNAIWELHMRLRIDDAGDAFASHRGWLFNNKTYLVGKDGKPIDHAGFETTMQQGNEIGLAYFFDLEGGLEGLTWVYETPTSIIRFPVDYELGPIALP